MDYSKNIYCYYIDDSSEISALVTSYESLKNTDTQHDVYCMLGSCLNTKISEFLHQIGIQPLLCNSLCSHSIKDIVGNKISECENIGKLFIYLYEQFDKIVYLNTNTQILKNIDELFEMPDGSMSLSHNDDNSVDTGIIVLTPRTSMWTNLWNMLLRGYSSNNFENSSDSSFLNQEYDFINREELHLNYMYNTNAMFLSKYKDDPLFDMSSIKVLQFNSSSDKKAENIEFEDNDIKSNEFIKNYIEFYDTVIDKYKNQYPYIPFANTVYGTKHKEI